MKTLRRQAKLVFAAALCPLALSLSAQTEKHPADLETLKGISGLPVTADVVAEFPASAETKSGSKLTCHAGVYRFTMPRDPKEAEKLKEKFNRKKVAPLRIGFYIDELKQGADKAAKYFKGKGTVLLVDLKAKKVIEKKSLDLSDLCPT